MLHVKDVLKRLIAGEALTAADVRPLPFVPDTAALDDVLTTMQRAHAHLAVVIDEHGGTAGLISIEDLIEEVVGENRRRRSRVAGARRRVQTGRCEPLVR